MCRLFAYKTKNPESANKMLVQALKEFQKLSEKGCVPCGIPAGHNDGWGIAAYKNGSPFLYTRSTEPAKTDINLRKAIEIIESSKPDLVIAHLRKATTGDNSIKNTHPFLSDNISFCHNGTINGFSKSKTESDSHKFFKQIITEDGNFKKVYNKIKTTYSYTAMNMLFSDGKKLIAVRNWNEQNPKAEELKLKEYYTLFSFKNNHSVFICSESLKAIEKLDKKLLKNKSVNVF